MVLFGDLNGCEGLMVALGGFLSHLRISDRLQILSSTGLEVMVVSATGSLRQTRSRSRRRSLEDEFLSDLKL